MSLPAAANPAAVGTIEKTACSPSCDCGSLQLYAIYMKNLAKEMRWARRDLNP